MGVVQLEGLGVRRDLDLRKLEERSEDKEIVIWMKLQRMREDRLVRKVVALLEVDGRSIVSQEEVCGGRRVGGSTTRRTCMECSFS